VPPPPSPYSHTDATTPQQVAQTFAKIIGVVASDTQAMLVSARSPTSSSSAHAGAPFVQSPPVGSFNDVDAQIVVSLLKNFVKIHQDLLQTVSRSHGWPLPLVEMF
jgi:hypothetical protein